MINSDEIVLIDLFAGVGGFHGGLEDAGFVFSKSYFSEIDKHAIANYKYNYPNAEYIGSVVDVCGKSIRAKHPNAHIIVTFGFPCQDLSIAGKRKGLTDGTRSSLLFEAGRVVFECKAQNFIAENVKGMSSVNEGRSFYEVLRFLTYFNTNYSQYTLEVQLFNTAWVLPQNRERYYFIGHIGNGSITRILPITENDFESNEKATTGKPITDTIVSVGYKDGVKSKEEQVAGTIQASYYKGYDTYGRDYIKINSNTISGEETANVGDSINYSVPNSKTRRGRVGKGVAQTLDTSCNQGVVVPTTLHGKNEVPTIRSGGRGSVSKKHSWDMVKQMNLSTESGGQQPYQQNRVHDAEGIAPTIDQGAGKWSVVAQRGRGEKGNIEQQLEVNNSGATNTLTGVQKDNMLFEASNIRRLSEVECERLQGFPDQHTKYGNYDGIIKEISKTQRYKMMGNAITRTMAEIIGIKLSKM